MNIRYKSLKDTFGRVAGEICGDNLKWLLYTFQSSLNFILF